MHLHFSKDPETFFQKHVDAVIRTPANLFFVLIDIIIDAKTALGGKVRTLLKTGPLSLVS